MDSKVVFKRTAHLAVTAGLAASMTLGSFPLAVFADATEPEQKPAVEQETPKAEEVAAEEQTPAAENATKVEIPVGEETQVSPVKAAQRETSEDAASNTVDELQDAISNATGENPTIQLSGDISAETPTVINVARSVTIKGAKSAKSNDASAYGVTLHNIVFKVTASSATFSDLHFTGKSRVQDASASSLTVTGCRMDVELNAVDYGWTSGAFVFGNDENHKVKMTITDNVLVPTTPGYGLYLDCAFLMDGSSISDNQIGSPEKGLQLFDNTAITPEVNRPIRNTGVAINIWNGDKDAKVTVANNKIYNASQYRSVIVYQNNSRLNTYTVTFSKNELHNSVSSAPFVKVFANADKENLDGAHLRAVLTADNTVNGNQISFDSVDVTDNAGNTTAGQYGLIATGVKLDQSGKMTAGIVKLGTTTVEDFNKSIAAADNKLPAKPNADGTYKVEAKYVAQVGTATYVTLKAAIDAANKAAGVNSVTIDLLADTKMDATAIIRKKIVLNGNGHQLNGQLLFGEGSDGSTVKGVHFVLNKDTACQAWVASVRITSGNGHNLIGNTFDIASDAGKNNQVASGKAISIYVFPDGHTKIDGTVIKGNTFDIAYTSGVSGWAVNLAAENDDSSIENTTVEGNTMTADFGNSASFLSAYAKSGTQHLVKDITLKGNMLAKDDVDYEGTLVYIQGGVDGMALQGNTFGAGGIGVEFQQDTRWGATPPSQNIDIKGNTFNTATAVKDSGAIKAKDLNSPWKPVPIEGNGIVEKTMKYAEYTGTESNIFGANTVPFKNTSLGANSYGAMFYDIDGVTLLDWQVVEKDKAPQDNKVGEKAGYTTAWYTDAEGKNVYDFKSDVSENGMRKLYLKRTPIEYKVSYDLDGGVNAEGNPSTFTVESGEIKLGAPTRDGYDFAGWVDKDGKKVESIAADTVGDIALKATWTKKAEPVANHTVTFVDGLGNKKTQTVTDGDKAVAPTDPKHDGWEFLGWYTSKDFKELYDFDAPVTGDLTLYGGWRKAGSDKVTEPEEETKPEAQKPGETKPADKKPGDKNALPKTGDDSALPVAVAAGAGVAAITAGVVASKRRKQE